MSLRTDAQELAAVLWRAVNALQRFHDVSRHRYTMELAGRLEPLVRRFDEAIRHRSGAAAADALDDNKPVIYEVTGATARGELKIFPDDTLDRYYRLATIFQESRYAAETL